MKVLSGFIFFTSMISCLGSLDAHRHEVIVIEEEPAVDCVVEQAPPEDMVEVCTPCPGANYFWIKGRWHWKHGWQWAPGRWEVRPYAAAVWSHGHWERKHHGWVWIEGHWTH